MKEFSDLLKKKAEEQAKSPVDPAKMEAKAAAIKNLMHEMKSLIGDELKGSLKKVTVASDSPEGLEEGLDKAKDIVAASPEMEEDEMEEEMSEPESEEMQSEEDRKIAELEKQLMELKAKKV